MMFFKKRIFSLLISAFIISFFLNYSIYNSTIQKIEKTVVKPYQIFLDKILEPQLFDNNSIGNVTDKSAIVNLAKSINSDPASSLKLHFWSVISQVSVKVVSIDGIMIIDSTQGLKEPPVVFSLFRNDKNREIILNVFYKINYFVLALHILFLIFCAWLLDFLLIKPISDSQQIWMQRLIADGYDDNEALSKSLLIPAQKDLSETQESNFNLLHQPELKNFIVAYELINNKELLALNESQNYWFQLAYQVLSSKNIIWEELLRYNCSSCTLKYSLY